jgi:hypothetical protein
MVENHKLKNVEERCKRLDERMQSLHQEFHESMADQQSKWQEQWVEQNKRTDQISLQIETLSNQFQSFLATQMARREVGANSRGILNTPTMEKKKMVLTAIKKEYCKDPVRTGRSN